MGEDLKAKVGDMVLSEGQWYEVIEVIREYYCAPKDGYEVYLASGDIEAVDRGPENTS